MTGKPAVDEEFVRLLARMSDDAPASILVHDFDGAILYANEETFRLHGYTRHEFMAKNLHEIDVPESEHLITERMERIRKNGKADFEVKHFRKDGSTIPLHVNVKIVDWGGRKVLLSIATDLTELTRVEKELHLFKDLVDHSSDAIGMSTPEGRHYYQNEAFNRLFGKIGDNPPETVYVDPAIGKQVFDTIMGGGSWQGEVKMFRKDGTILDIFLRAYAIKDPEGHVIGLIGLHTDITERKRAEKALRESEIRYRNLYESSRDAIMTLEPPLWRFTTGNPATLQMFMARDEAEFTSREPWTLSPDRQPDGRESADKAKEMIETAMQNGTHFFEWTHKRLNGEEFPATVLLSRVELSGKVFLQATVRDITEQKRAEKQLHEAVLRWQTTFDSTQDAICVLDADQKIVICNRMMHDMVGTKDADDLTGRHCWEVVHGTKEPIPGCPIVRMRDSLKRETMELQIGDRFFVVTSDPVLENEGALVGAVHNIRDITEQRRAEEAVRESEQKFHAIFDAARDGMLVADPEIHRFIMANAAIREQTGYTEAELLSLTISGIHPPAELPYVIEQYGKHVRGEINLAPDIPVLRKDGTVFFADISSAPVTLRGRQYLLGIFRDVTERKKAEEQLKKTETEFRSLISNSADIIAVLDTAGNFLFISPSFETILGYRKAKTSIRNTIDLVHPDDVQKAKEIMQSSAEYPEKIYSVELRIRHADGSWRTMEVIGRTSSFGGHDRVIIINARDITGRKAAEEQLRVLVREKEILLFEIHHRVRNIIQLAMSMMEIQIRRESDERVREIIADTRNRLNAIASTFNRLYYSENMSRIDLRQVISAIVDPIKETYGTGKRTIQAGIHIDLAELGVDLALPLALIASELVTNSFRHAFPEGSNGMVTITVSEEREGQIIMTIHDNGTGLPEGFSPLESVTTGLTVARILVGQIRGTMSYTSSGKGTSFVITVPRNAESSKSGMREP